MMIVFSSWNAILLLAANAAFLAIRVEAQIITNEGLEAVPILNEGLGGVPVPIPKTDTEICENLVQHFYWEEDDESGTSLIRENKSCRCHLSDDNQFFRVKCRLDYCGECNSAGVCGVWHFRNRYRADFLRRKENAFSYDEALVDVSQCVEYVQGRDETVCTTTSADGQTCKLQVNGRSCNSCRWRPKMCNDPKSKTSGGFSFNCQNFAADGGGLFNSCNRVSETTQAVALDSVFALFDDQSLQFKSCYDSSVVVTKPPHLAVFPPKDKETTGEAAKEDTEEATGEASVLEETDSPPSPPDPAEYVPASETITLSAAPTISLGHSMATILAGFVLVLFGSKQ